MKTVFSNDMVAHVWAQQNQSEGRNSSNTLYFRDSTIYSYGLHFPIARFITNKKGEKAVLFTYRGYSQSTSRHISYVSRSLFGLNLPTFHVYDPSETSFTKEVAEKDFGVRIKRALEQSARARLHAEGYLSQAVSLANEANDLAKFLGQRWRLKVPVIDPEFIAKVRADVKAANSKNAKRLQKEADEREARRLEEMQKLAERKVEWLAGADVHYDSHSYDDTLLRVKGDQVQTSRGAEIPVGHARRVWPTILKCQADERPFLANGHTIKVGNFSIDRIDANGDIKAGCHFIKFDQVHKIAQQLGLAQGAQHADIL